MCAGNVAASKFSSAVCALALAQGNIQAGLKGKQARPVLVRVRQLLRETGCHSYVCLAVAATTTVTATAKVTGTAKVAAAISHAITIRFPTPVVVAAKRTACA